MYKLNLIILFRPTPTAFEMLANGSKSNEYSRIQGNHGRGSVVREEERDEARGSIQVGKA